MKLVLEPNEKRNIKVFNTDELITGMPIMINNKRMLVLSCGPFNITLLNNKEKKVLSLNEVEEREVSLRIV